MATPAQAQANRVNAQSSTGPKTTAGKQKSAENNLRHGLASGRLIIAGECRDDYDALERDLLASHKPVDETEKLLVQQMAQHYWLTQRALGLQAKAFDGCDGVPKDLAILIRYQTANERAFHKALAALTKLQKERRKEQIGFESQKQILQRKIDKLNQLKEKNWCEFPIPGQPGYGPDLQVEILEHVTLPL